MGHVEGDGAVGDHEAQPPGGPERPRVLLGGRHSCAPPAAPPRRAQAHVGVKGELGVFQRGEHGGGGGGGGLGWGGLRRGQAAQADEGFPALQAAAPPARDAIVEDNAELGGSRGWGAAGACGGEVGRRGALVEVSVVCFPPPHPKRWPDGGGHTTKAAAAAVLSVGVAPCPPRTPGTAQTSVCLPQEVFGGCEGGHRLSPPTAFPEGAFTLPAGKGLQGGGMRP